MSEATRVGRRAKRFLTPSKKYEIWLQLVRQEVTIAEAAAEHQVDRSTIMRIRTIAMEGALAALAASQPGAAVRGAHGDGRAAEAGRGKKGWGLNDNDQLSAA